MSDKFAPHGVHNGLKTAMCFEFLVHVVEMVAEGLQTNPQRTSDFGRILAVCKQAQYALLLFRESGNRSGAPCAVVVRHCNNLFGELKHLVQQILIVLSFRYVAGQMHDEARVSSAIFKDQG